MLLLVVFSSAHATASYRYIYESNARSWTSAKTYCQSRGGELAAATSAEVNQAILESGPGNDFWIGGQYQVHRKPQPPHLWVSHCPALPCVLSALINPEIRDSRLVPTGTGIRLALERWPGVLEVSRALWWVNGRHMQIRDGVEGPGSVPY